MIIDAVEKGKQQLHVIAGGRQGKGTSQNYMQVGEQNGLLNDGLPKLKNKTPLFQEALLNDKSCSVSTP